MFCVTLRTGREFLLAVIVSRSQLQAVSSFLMLFLHPNLNFSANSLREDYKFHHTFSNEIAKLLKASPGKLVVMQPEKFQSKYEPKMHVLNLKVGSWSRAKKFVFGIEGSLSLFMISWHLPVGSTPARYLSQPVCPLKLYCFIQENFMKLVQMLRFLIIFCPYNIQYSKVCRMS